MGLGSLTDRLGGKLAENVASKLADAQRTFRQLTALFPSDLPSIVSPRASGAEAARFRDPKSALCGWDNKQIQWWYFTGHLKSRDGRRFGFELVFFDRRTHFDYLGVVPSRLIAPKLFVSHFAITDVENGKFHYWHRGGLMDPSEGTVSPEQFYVQVDGWSARQTADGHLRVNAIDGQNSISLDLDPAKTLAYHHKNGFSPRGEDPDHASFYCSYSRLKTSGHLSLDGEVFEVEGESWMDHEKMTMRPELLIHGWNWYSIQLEDGVELMLYMLKAGKGSSFCPKFSFGSLIDPSGAVTEIAGSAIEILHLDSWKSPKTGAAYPTRAWIQIPSHGLSLEVAPLVEDCELDVVRNCFLSYWEGPISVTGEHGGRPTEGAGFLELVGYDQRTSTKMLQFLVIPEPAET